MDDRDSRAAAGRRLLEHDRQRFGRPSRRNPLHSLAVRILSAYVEPSVRGDDAEALVARVLSALGLEATNLRAHVVSPDPDLAREGRELLEWCEASLGGSAANAAEHALLAATAASLDAGLAPERAVDALRVALANAGAMGPVRRDELPVIAPSKAHDP